VYHGDSLSPRLRAAADRIVMVEVRYGRMPRFDMMMMGGVGYGTHNLKPRKIAGHETSGELLPYPSQT